MCNLSKGVREKGIAEGVVRGRAEGIAQTHLASIQNLMETLGLTAEQAMAGLKVPDSEKQKYRDLLSKQ